MKKILSLLLCVIMILGLVGCGGQNKEISKSKKEKIKKQISEELKDRNVTNIDILTESETRKPIAVIQLQGNIEKANINKEELELLSKEISNKISTIVEKYTIEFIDKNYQIIMQNDNGTITYSE